MKKISSKDGTHKNKCNYLYIYIIFIKCTLEAKNNIGPVKGNSELNSLLIVFPLDR